MESVSLDILEGVANQLRIDSITATTAAESGHVTSCCSIAEIMAALFFSRMRYDPKDPHNPNNDRFILSKGHAAPILYAAWAEAGLFPVSNLKQLRRIDSDLEGHPTPRLSFVDVATGSLGQGLSCGIGMALSARMDGRGFHTYVILGDGECAEGSVWEAAALAGVKKLNNLTAIIDVNRLGQSGETALGYDLNAYRRRFEAFGWRTAVIDGHNLNEILAALDSTGDLPLAIVARTVKGQGLEVAGLEDWHGKPLPEQDAMKAIATLRPKAKTAVGIRIEPPLAGGAAETGSASPMQELSYKRGDSVATRAAFGSALARVGASDTRIVALDGDVKNSTYSEKFFKAFPERSVECFIAEQNMVGVAVGLASRGKIPFVSTFACFLTRAFDQIRMAAISQSNLKICGTHSGISIGEDGPSQMGLEDIAMMRAVEGSIVLCPCDAVSTERLVEVMAASRGIFYLRTARPKTPVLYGLEEQFPVGGAKVVRQTGGDKVTVVAAGVTVFEALKAAVILKQEDLQITVIDAYSIKPLAADLIRDAARKTGRLVLTVEDHYSEGGLGDAVAGCLSADGMVVHKLAVRELPRSGKAEELLAKYKIDSQAIVRAAKAMLGR